jgi:sirohydrochlorin ferrochelatase
LKILLLVAHGSRQVAANQAIRELAAQVESASDSEYGAVVAAFLEFAEPDIASGIDHCAKLGATNIAVIPYFLSAGAHVNRDIPEQLQAASLRYPQIGLTVAPHFGAMEGMVDAVIKCASTIKDL